MDYSRPAKQNPFSDIRIKSDLMMKMEPLLSDGPDSENDEDKDGDFPLTLEEIVEKRKEMMKLKMKESHKIAKARRQSKIKSKKYHKLLKREKIKEQMKEFEILQKTDPEAALKKLEQIDRHRVEERANLRHKNTGTWAKNLQVRAKYDKDVRKELAQQLNVGRELTQKQKIDEDSSGSENENEYGDDYDPFNPWMNKKKADIEKGEEVENLSAGYKKYWETRNSNEKKRKIFDEIVVEDDEVELVPVETEKPIQSKKKVKRIEKVKKVEVISTESNWEVESFDSDSSQNPEEEEVHNFETKQSLEEIFDVVEDNLALKLKNKLHKIQNQESEDEFEPTSKKNRKSDKKSDLAFKNKSNRPEIDESLDESGNKNQSQANEQIDSIKKISSADVAVTKEVSTIDPNEFVAMKPKYLQTAIPDMNNYDENIDDDENESRAVAEKTMTIAEAFAEDDIVADFVQEKDDEKKKDIQENIDMTLPGWGSWGGTGIKKATKNKRFLLKFPKELPRRDDNKDSVILYEDSNEKIKSHLVSDLPFPFTSVSDFEASIRAPIGNEFVPQIAHKALTKPPIKTKLGTVIQPMDENNLISSLRTVKPKTKTDIKIHKMMTNRSKKDKLVF